MFDILLEEMLYLIFEKTTNTSNLKINTYVLTNIETNMFIFLIINMYEKITFWDIIVLVINKGLGGI